jgi:hypothetical protein
MSPAEMTAMIVNTEKLQELDCKHQEAWASSFKTRLSKRDSAVTITETSEAKAKISANKELAVTKAARENMNEDTKQKEAHHSGSEFAANIH